MTEQNARITATQLGPEDHGIFTAWLTLDYGGAGQGFGGFAFDGWSGAERVGSVFGMQYIMEVLRVLEVDRWERLPGTFCRVRATDGGVEAIGHVLKDQWFVPKDLASRLRAERGT